MKRRSDLKKEYYKTGEVAVFLGVSIKTVQRYDENGILKFTRTEKGHRLLPKDELVRYMDSRGMLYDDTELEKRDVIYVRVSSHEQKDKGDLDRQALFLVENAEGLLNPLILKEVGSGLNDKRPQLLGLIDLVMEGRVRNVYVTYRDRLTRFGYHYLERVFSNKDVQIIVVKDIQKEKSVSEELVEDMMSLIAGFSGKLYGMRRGGNSSKKEQE